jgi:hypothetical protein
MSEMAATDKKMGLPRTLLAIGFFTIVLGVVIGAATEGSPVARYVALAGLVPIAAAAVAFIVQFLQGRLGNRGRAAAR